jgi:hypothetical protein
MTSKSLTLLGMTASLGVVLALPAGVRARPPYRKALADFLGLANSSRLNDCRTCHLPDKPGTPAAALPAHKPHNAFGARLKAVGKQLKKAGKQHDIPARLLAVAGEDSDGDGIPNLVELLTGHFPGEARDRPTPAEVAEGRKKQVAFLAALKEYRWKPFERVERPPLPAIKGGASARNPVDVFLAAEHERRGLRPRPEAPKAVLLRRVYLDLIGLPPTRAELHAFLADRRPDAYERVVDRLLADPRYGERWGRHWLDVWRYSDWAGFGMQVRDSQKHIWHWRDWVVESLNADKGYDRMVVEMLAADELAPTDPDSLRATGFLVRNYKLLSREKWMEDTVDHTAQAFLGITLGCARCHDHMFDPITQEEYYRVRAIFTPHQVRTDRLPAQPDLKKDGLPRVYDADLTAPTYRFIRGDDRTPDKTPLAPGVPEALGGTFKVEAVKLPREAYEPDRRPFVAREELAASAERVAKAEARIGPARLGVARALGLDAHPLRAAVELAGLVRAGEALARAELEADLAKVRHRALEAVLRAEGLEDKGRTGSREWKEAATEAARAQRRAAVLQARRNLLLAREGVRKAPPARRAALGRKVAAAEAALKKAESDARRPATKAYTKRAVRHYPATSTGRRLAFARWVANRDNPLAARVAVNHVWLRHFGKALAPGVFDLGRNAAPPSHPALLDWLAAEFMGGGWSMKRLHRLVVTSSAYRMASTPDPDDLARDPDNRYVWRMAPRRAEAEVVRDSVFYVAGRLEQRLGGPDVDHGLGLVVPRRSLYFRHAAEKRMEFLTLFDGPGVTECYERKPSIMPQQALALINSEVTLRHARLLARRLAGEVGQDPAAFTAAAFEAVLSRPPTAEERAECVAFLKARAERFARAGRRPGGVDTEGRLPSSDPGLRAREGLVHVLMNHHEFVTVR